MRTLPLRRGLARLAVALLLSVRPAAAQFPPEVRGRVVGVEDGVAVVGATVEVVGGGQRTVTRADGGFHLRGLVPGRREIRVSAFGYRERRLEVAAENGRVETVTVELVPLPVEIEGVVARGERPALGATRIPREAIASSGSRDLAELLQEQPGLTVTRRGGPGSPATVSIRGSGADEVLVLVDGIPINSPLTGEADFSSVPLEAVERVTVLRGAQSARYGPRALAGVILVETRRPSARELSARAAAGAWGEHAAAVTAGDRVSLGGLHLSGLLAGEWRGARSDFPYVVPRVRGGGEATRRNADVRLLSGLAQVALEGGSGGLLRARLESFRVERGMPGSIVQPALAARQTQERHSVATSAGGRWGGVALRLDLDAQTQDAAFSDPTPPFGPAYAERVSVRTLGGTLSAGMEAGSLALSLGAEARHLDVASSMLASGHPAGQLLAGAWAQAQAALPLRGEWTAELQPALRADHSSLHGGVILSPRAAVSLSRSRLTARLSLGNAFSPPSLADQFFQEGLLARPNPGLRPERVRGEVEVGVRVRDLVAGATRTEVELAAHRSDVEGMILWFPDHRFVWQPDNFDVRRRGWEASSRTSLPWLAAELRGSVSAVAVEYAGAALAGQVRYRPGLTASAGAAATVLGVRADLATRFVGERRTVAGSDLNTLPAYWLSDLRLSRSAAVGGWWGELSLALENLFDREAAMLVDYPFPGRTWSVALRLRPEARREGNPGDATLTPKGARR